jgi:hypothetical protein
LDIQFILLHEGGITVLQVVVYFLLVVFFQLPAANGKHDRIEQVKALIAALYAREIVYVEPKPVVV